MTKKLYSTLAMMSLILMLAVSSAQAQSKGALEINVPFDFNVGSKTLPAGSYTVKQLTQNSMLVRSADGETSAIAQTVGGATLGANEKTAAPRLIFRQYGDQYFLAQVWMVKDGEGRALNKSDAEMKAAETLKLAGNADSPRTIAIAATRAR